MSSHYAVRSSRGGFVTILLSIACLFVIWTQLASYLGGNETHTFKIDGDNTVETNMQVNVDMTVASPCDSLIINVLDQSNDRLLASEILQMDEVEFTGPHDDIPELALLSHDDLDLNDDDDDEGYGDNDNRGKEMFDLLQSSDELKERYLERRKETLHSVLRRAKRKSVFQKSTPVSKKKQKELDKIKKSKAEDFEDPPQSYTDGTMGCRIYGSFPVTKVQGNLHVISKAFFVSDGHLSVSQRKVFTSQHARNDLWKQHRGRFSPSHYLFSQVNFTHYIDELSFGEFYPNLVNPLDGTRSRWPRRTLRNRLGMFFNQETLDEKKKDITTPKSKNKNKNTNNDKSIGGISKNKLTRLVQEMKNQASAISSYQYFVSIVPTTYIASTTGRKVKTNQYAVTEQVRDLSWQYEFDYDLEEEIPENKENEEDKKESEKLTTLKRALKSSSYSAALKKGFSSSSSSSSKNNINNNNDHELKTSSTPPGIFLRYDIEPILLEISDTRLPFAQFVVRVVNILGGLVVCTFASYRLIESLLVKIFGKKYSPETDQIQGLGILDDKEKVKETETEKEI